MSEIMNQGKLAAKMVLAMKSIDAVAKTGKNTKQGYDYVTAADVADEVRSALVEHGIAFDYSIVDTDRWEKATSSGGSMACVQVTADCTFTDAVSGESKTVRGIGWGMDSLDKAPYKAMTGLLKYVLRMNFIIPDNADPENDGETRQQPQTQRAVKPFTPSGAEIDYHTQMQRDSRRPNATSDADEDFDAHMAHAEQERQPQVRKQGPVISAAQAKRFFGIAMGSGKQKNEINNYLAIHGYGHTEEILRSEYEQHCEWAASK
jgi:hypothetical protein